MMIPVHLNPGDTLIREGEPSDCMYIVKSGELIVSKFANDKPTHLGYIKAGETIGEMSFLDGLVRSATVKAISDVILMQIPHSMMEEVEKKLPPWYKALMRTLLDRLRKANAKVKV